MLCLRLWHYVHYVPQIMITTYHYGSWYWSQHVSATWKAAECTIPRALGPPVLLLGILWIRRLACDGQGVDVRCNPDLTATLTFKTVQNVQNNSWMHNDLHGTWNLTCKTESQSSGLFRHGGAGWGIEVWTSFGCHGSLSGCIRLLAWRLKIYQGSRLSCLTDGRTRIRSDEALSNRQSRLVAIDYAESQVQGFKVVVVHVSVNLVREEFWGGEFLKFCWNPSGYLSSFKNETTS